MATYKSPTQPLCRFCGLKIPKVLTAGKWDGQSYKDQFFGSQDHAIQWAYKYVALQPVPTPVPTPVPVPVPPPPAPAPPPPPPPATTTAQMSGDAWQGDAIAHVVVNGASVGDYPVSAIHANGAWQAVTFPAKLGDAVEVTLANDAWGGTADTDRNLYVKLPDGTEVAIQGGDNKAAWTVGGAPAPVPTPTPTPAPPPPPPSPAPAPPPAPAPGGVTVPLKALMTTVSIKAGSKQATLGSAAGFAQGDPIVIEVGAESGRGVRGTVGVGGVWPRQANRGYYFDLDVPKALITTIDSLSGNVATLRDAASADANGANLWYDNRKIWNASVPSGAGGKTFQMPGGKCGFAGPVSMDNLTDCTFAGLGQATTELYSPKGADCLTVTANNPTRCTFRDFHVHANVGLNGYGFGTNNGALDKIGGLHVNGGADCIVLNVKGTDGFRTICINYGGGHKISNVQGFLSDPLPAYVQWQIQCADTSKVCTFEDVTVTSKWLTQGFETFSELGTIFRRCGGTNASWAANSAGGYLFEDCFITLTPNCQSSSDSFNDFNPLVDINTNIRNSTPSRPDFPTQGGGTVKNFRLVQQGFINDRNITSKGISVQPGNPNVKILSGGYDAPDYFPGALGQGPVAIISEAPGLVVDGFTATGKPATTASYNCNILAKNGTVRNSKAPVIKASIDGGNNQGQFVPV